MKTNIAIAIIFLLVGMIIGLAIDNYRWQNMVINLQAKLLTQGEELEEHRIDMAKKQVHDMRTWDDTIPYVEYIPDTLDTTGGE